MPTPLSWPDCRNVRDLGGLPTIDGGQIRSGALIRSDSLTRLNDEGAAMVKAAGVRRIVDLRNVDEAVPHAFSGDASLYRLVPLIDPAREPDRSKKAERTLAEIYCSSLTRNAKSIVEGVAAVADAPDGPVLVHCAVGKDRTGIIVALVLSVAGVAPSSIAEDYAYSAQGLQSEHDALLARFDDETDRRRVAERMSCRPETMLAMLSHASTTFGGVAEYLQAHGLSKAQLARLSDRLTE